MQERLENRHFCQIKIKISLIWFRAYEPAAKFWFSALAVLAEAWNIGVGNPGALENFIAIKPWFNLF